MANSSGIGVKSSASSCSISSEDLAVRSSSSVGGGSHEAMRRWLLARATLARLKMMSASLVDVDAGIVGSCSARNRYLGVRSRNTV